MSESIDKTSGCVLKLASCNILAGGSIKGYRQYLTQSWKQVLPTPSKRANLDELAHLISEFDLVGLQEADAGSLRSAFLNQTHYLAETAKFPYWSYQPNRKVSSLAYSANGLLSQIEPIEILSYALPGRLAGRGALWARFGEEVSSLVVVIAHLALGFKARTAQINFLTELIGNTSHVVLMGDLNCEAYSAELQPLFARTSLTPPTMALPSFPSWQPRRAIDHILVSDDIEIEKLWTLPYAVSDHLPIAARICLPKESMNNSPSESILFRERGYE